MSFLLLLSAPLIAALFLVLLLGFTEDDNRLHTFIVDPFTMLLVGAFMVLLAHLRPKGAQPDQDWYLRRRRAVDFLLVCFLAGFWTMELLTYFNYLGHPFLPGRTGNDFMWNGYLDFFMGRIVDTTVPTYESARMNLLALPLFLSQAGFLWLGRQLGLKIVRRQLADAADRK